MKILSRGNLGMQQDKLKLLISDQFFQTGNLFFLLLSLKYMITGNDSTIILQF